MLRQALCGLAVLFLVSGLSAFPVPKGAGSKDVADSTFAGDISGDLCRITFKANGRLLHRGRSDGEGTWKQDGTTITWHVNHYSTYEAALDGEQMQVRATNKDGWKAEFTLTRQKSE